MNTYTEPSNFICPIGNYMLEREENKPDRWFKRVTTSCIPVNELPNWVRTMCLLADIKVKL